MSLNKSYYSRKDYPCHSETIVLSNLQKKIAQFQHSQSVESLQKPSVGQNYIAALKIDKTSIVGIFKYQPKIYTSSNQRSKAIFKQSNYYPPQQLPIRGYSLNHKTYRRIAELGADNETYKYTLEWLKRLHKVITSNQMWWREPLVNLSFDSEIVFEWWHKNKKLTVYILGNTVEYIKVWGIDIDNEMEDGSATSPVELMNLWKWLIS